jgi:hypothetical protein
MDKLGSDNLKSGIARAEVRNRKAQNGARIFSWLNDDKKMKPKGEAETWAKSRIEHIFLSLP